MAQVLKHTRQHSIVIVGSANMDLSIPVSRIPVTGETILGGNMMLNPGGKGANQAVAAQRACAAETACHFIGRVGDDVFGKHLQQSLTAEGINTERLLTTAGQPTGTAAIMVNPAGDNAIVVSPGANACLRPADIHAQSETIASARVLVVQLEIPLDTVAAALKIAREAGILTILDPAPPPLPKENATTAMLPRELWQVDIFSPNQTEAFLLSGIKISDLDSAHLAATHLLQYGPKCVLLKLGEMGSAIATRNEAASKAISFTHIPPIHVTVADTTAAGDTFTGALAAFLAEGKNLHAAARLAGIGASLACTKMGAQSSIPNRQEILSIASTATGCTGSPV